MIELYDKTNIDKLSRPSDFDGQYAYDYCVPMIQNGVQKYIKNVKTKLYLLKLDDILLPININDAEYENSYVSSLYTHYISYTITELKELKNIFLERIFRFLLSAIGIFLKIGKINKVVYVNNWFLPTNLYLDLTKKQLSEITSFFKKNFSNHTIIFRSVNASTNPSVFDGLKDLNYHFIGSRQVYLFGKNHLDELKGKEKNKVSHDIRLLEDSDYLLKTIIPKNYTRAVDLYNQLYLEKYSYLNPQFSEDFIKLTNEKKLIHYFALQKGNSLDGIMGYFYRNAVITTPIVGYKMSIPQEVGLYKMIMAKTILEGNKNNATINMSSGASSFKIYRGSIPAIEYTAVYHKHLPFYRRFVFSFLENLINKIAIPIIKKKNL